MTSHALLSSEQQDWETPPWFLDMVRDVSADGTIALDPFTTTANPTKATRYFAPVKPAGAVVKDPAWLGPCGLAGVWPARTGGLTFANPRYGAHLSGDVSPDYEIKRKNKKTGIVEVIGIGRGNVAKLVQHRNETIALLPARTDAAWWKVAFHWADLVLFWSSPEHGARISFVNPETGEEQQGSNLASMVLYRASEEWLRRHVGRDRFAEVFGPHGTLVVGGARRGVMREQLSLGGAA